MHLTIESADLKDAALCRNLSSFLLSCANTVTLPAISEPTLTELVVTTGTPAYLDDEGCDLIQIPEAEVQKLRSQMDARARESLAAPAAPAPVVYNPPNTTLVATDDEADAPDLPAAGKLPDGREVDSAGVPHDMRIHSETKARVAGGKWRYRRNLDKQVKAQVEAEIGRYTLTATGYIRAGATIAAPAAPAPVTVTMAEPAPVVAAPAPAAPAPAAPTPAAPIDAGDAPTEFAKFMPRLVPLMAPVDKGGRGLSKETLDLALSTEGVSVLHELAQKPHLIAPVWNRIHEYLALGM